MLPTARVMKLLTDEAETLEGDARQVEAMLPKLPESESQAWKETAKEYRERARDYKSRVVKKLVAARVPLKNADLLSNQCLGVRCLQPAGR